jgi:hypothetical protein
MEFQIAFPPDLGITPEAFAAEWNADAESRSIGEARFDPDPSKQYDFGVIIGLVIIPLLVSISANAFYDLRKARLVASGVRKRTQLIEVEQPDGSRLLVVVVEEE